MCVTDTHLQAYSIFDMNVVGLVQRGVSTTYSSTVGNAYASASVIMAPDADHVNTSICPGVSTITYLYGNIGLGAALAQRERATHSSDDARLSTKLKT